uniref:Aminoacyl-tRNA synthetase class I anticodon-binding domain-containing protein n=1 Tax=Arion vulgaris TaxID=1028688 RepID=A0A0B7A600_9EUPU
MKTSKYFMVLRMALTGLKEGPPVAEMMSVFGKDNVIRRLKSTLESVRSS